VLGIAAALVIQFVRGGEHWMLWLLPPVSLVTGAMIMGEVELLLAFFGHRLERLDPSSERF
jgi:hypothetical protein